MRSSSKNSSPDSASQLLAHSAREESPVQLYRSHIKNVNHLGTEFCSQMVSFWRGESEMGEVFSQIVETATCYHDLGKLDESFQWVLFTGKNLRRVRHEHAGTVFLFNKGNFEAAGLVAAHHQGLLHYEKKLDDETPGFSEEWDTTPFLIEDEFTQKQTEINLDEYLFLHEKEIGPYNLGSETIYYNSGTGLFRRLLLSCVVDADHSDTANHYGNESREESPKTRWEERIKKLDEYVNQLKKGTHTTTEIQERRQKIRNDLYYHGCHWSGTNGIIYCDSVVGSGKTTSIMAHLLRVAQEMNLRHIIVVLPYTNIIRQSVDVYRRCLVLDDEDPEKIIAEHHHRADFECENIRHLTTLWRAPIIVTTAVQFFETLSSRKTARLRKLHELPGSAVFLDEAHNALSYELWPIAWVWLNELVRDWKGHLVLSSGSLPTFWDDDDFLSVFGKEKNFFLPVSALTDSSFVGNSLLSEQDRIFFRTERIPLSEEALALQIEQSLSPRIVVVNSLMSAAKLADLLKKRGRLKVLHLSAALAPVHREDIIKEIEKMLGTNEDWVLVATSLVEAGMDFSFASGFRQRASVASLIQLGGRINRHSRALEPGCVVDFTFENNTHYPDNPSLKKSQEILVELFAEGEFERDKAIDLKAICLKAMKVEFRRQAKQKGKQLLEWEYGGEYPKVDDEFKVINTDTVTVVVDEGLAKKLQCHKKVDRRDIQKYSVQMASVKVGNYGLKEIGDDLYCLPDGWEYDPLFLGYMKEVLRNESYRIGGDGYCV